MNMLKSVTAVVALALSGAVAQGAVIVQWTFEVSQPISAGPHPAEVGTGSALGTTGGTYSNPVGPGSLESFSSNNWNVGEYWQFSTSTTGAADIGVSFDATGSNTGPRDFTIAYSTDGTNFTDFANYTLVNASWSSSAGYVNPPEAHFEFDLSGVDALENQSTVYFRLINTTTTSIAPGTVAATGTSRVDNFTVISNVPEPAGLAAIGLGGLALLRRRRSR